MTTEININDYTIREIKEALAKVEHSKTYRKEYYQANREELLAKEKAYRKAHPDIERNKYNRKKDDPRFREKRRVKNAKSYQRRKERLAAEKAAAEEKGPEELILGKKEM